MKVLHKIPALCALALAFCLTLAGRGGGPKQAAADTAEEAVINFLTNLQKGEFDQAKTYLEEGNPLLILLPAPEGGEAPELDGVYQQFREKLSGLSFRVGDEGAVGNSMVYITAAQYDFSSAINDAMLASMGEEGTVRAMASKKSSVYTIDYRSYTGHDFMNLVTGGFYDYADFQMAVCTGSMDGVEHTYYIAALGDQVIAYVEEISEADAAGELDEETVVGLNEFYAQFVQQTPGLYAGVVKEGSRVITRFGIDFQTADQSVLVDAGIVSGNYQGNMADGWLSLAGTVGSFEEAGMTCTITSVYEAKK